MDYPDRSTLVSEMTRLLKLSLRPVAPDDLSLRWSGPTGYLALDREGARWLVRLVARMAEHEHFEHENRDDLRKAVLAFVTTYAIERKGNKKELAIQFLDGLAKEPDRAVLYFTVRDLKLTGEIQLGECRLLSARRASRLVGGIPRGVRGSGTAYIEVSSAGGNPAALKERGRRKAELALAMLRRKLRRGPGAAHRKQTLFDLGEWYAVKIPGGEKAAWCWEHGHKAFGADLGKPGPDWVEGLLSESEDVARLEPVIRKRFENSLWWADYALRAPTWKVAVPAVMTAIESLLVPEDCGSKAEVVLVRSIALQLCFDEWFTDPDQTYAWYMVRCDLVHGEPTEEPVNKKSSDDDSWKLDHWADEILTAFVKFAIGSGHKKITELVRRLDDSTGAEKAAHWLDQQGDAGAEVLRKYREALRRA